MTTSTAPCLTAYGWEDLIPALVGKPGATLPSLHKTEAQEQAEEELLTRLVALNHERAAEERRGLVRWLRPDYQIPKLGVKAPKPEGEHVGVLDIELLEIGRASEMAVRRAGADPAGARPARQGSGANPAGCHTP